MTPLHLSAITAAAATATVLSQAPRGDTDRGKQLFVKTGCYQCHGYEAQGASTGPKLGPDAVTFSRFVTYVRKPTGDMPPYTARVMSDAELADVYAFVTSRPQPTPVALGGAVLPAAQRGVDEHIAAAKAAAGDDYKGLFDRLCTPEPSRPQAQTTATPRPATPPDRAEWHAEPQKVFDNLYFVGTREHSAWAIVTSAGIIVTDPLYAYAVEDEVVAGLRKVGLDPGDIKYVLVSHGHGDHSGGARHLQDTFGAKVILSAADWDLLARNARTAAQPKRDLVATDGYRLTLGDTTLILYLTPGHTPGTISTLIPVRDGSTRHLVALWGGTAFNFQQVPQNYESYIASAEKFAAITAEAGADVIVSNHTAFDGSTAKLPAVRARRPGEPHPYVVGAEGIKRYLTVAAECAKAGLARLPSR